MDNEDRETLELLLFPISENTKRFSNKQIYDLLISEKFDDPRFVYFAQRLIYEESPTSLPEAVYKKVHRKIAEQINSINNEKWNTLAKSTKEIDDLRVKHENNEQKLKLLDDIDEFLEEIRQQYETA
jgi:exodeoxyribonuclease-1